MRILLCEDHPVEMKVIQVALEGENIDWTCVNDGRKALRLLEDGNTYDMIITDIHMPYHNGDDILTFVRDKQKKSIPIIMVSSDGQEEVIKLALKLGVDEFLEKPLDPATIRKKIKKYIH
jgi:DNA-binding response OmpR family regulator